MLYREMFDEVHAPQNLKMEVMNVTKQERTQVVRKISVSFIVAAVLAVVLAGTALAAVIGVPETLQDWFGQQWTEAGGGEMPEEQSQIIDSLVQPVNVTCINKGVSVTLDSVTPSEGGLWLLYKVKGEALEKEGLMRSYFMGMDLGGKVMESEIKQNDITIHGGGDREIGVTEDGTHIRLMFFNTPDGVNFLEGGNAELRLDELNLIFEQVDADGEKTQDFDEIDAKWILPFTLEPTEEGEALTAESARVVGTHTEWEENAEEPTETKATIEIRDIRVTSTSFTYTHSSETAEYHVDAPVLQMSDGMTINGNNGGAIVSGKEDIRGSWDIPVDISKVEAICFGDVVIPLTQPKK